MTNPTLERAARAACVAAGQDPDGIVTDIWIHTIPDVESPMTADRPAWTEYVEIARAVLMAVRDMPMGTVSDIFTARDGFVHTLDIPAVWQLGIDAILAEGE